jgi:NO-binding membrane sensor protein with MHYT domain
MMVHVNEFSYGLLTPGVAFMMSGLGSFLGLRCASRARASSGVYRTGWLLLAALSIGATAIWVMHNIAMLGLTIAGQTILYDVPMSLLSAFFAVAVVFAALMIVGFDAHSFPRLLIGGTVIGAGVLVSMDYLGMAAMRMPDAIHYNPWVVLLSVLIAVAAATFSLWATLRLHGMRTTVIASVAMAVGINGMHYTVLTSMRFVPTPGAAGMLSGATVGEFVLPLVLVISVLTLILTASIALSPTEEEIRTEAILSERLARQRERSDRWAVNGGQPGRRR